MEKLRKSKLKKQDIDTECDNCCFSCKESEIMKNFDGFCDDCQRWYSCIHSDEKPCLYFHDSCNYLCRECRNGLNFILDNTSSIEYKEKQILQIKKYLIDLENELKILKQKLKVDNKNFIKIKPSEKTNGKTKKKKTT